MYVALASMILNAVLAWFLGFHLGYGHIGLALASSISAFFTVVVLIYLLKREDVYEASEGWGLFWIRLIFASAVLILFINYFGDEVSILRELNDLGKIFYILKMVFLGIALYLLALRITGLKLRDFVN